MSNVAPLNADAEAKRRAARTGSPNVNPHEQARERTEYLLELLDEKIIAMNEIDEARAALAEEQKALTDRKKSLDKQASAIYDDLEAEGIDREAFKDSHKQAKRRESDRIKYEATRRLCWTAHGLETGDQLEFVSMLEAEMAALPDDQVDALDGESETH